MKDSNMEEQIIERTIRKLCSYSNYIFDPRRGLISGFNGKFYADIHEILFLKRIKQLTKRKIKSSAQKQLLEEFKVRIADQLPEVGENQGYLNFSNGVLSVKDRVLLPHSPNRIFFHVIGNQYDPKATCPKFLRFITEITRGDDNLIKFLQEFFGYCLLPGLPYHMIVILFGSGGNGKSVLLEILINMLGKENCSFLSIQDIVGQRFRLAELDGKLVNVSNETPKGADLANPLLKELSSGGYVVLEKKGKDPYMRKNGTKFILSTNVIPRVSEQNDGAERRLYTVPIDVKISQEKIDPYLVKKLNEELPGILNWSIEGLERLQSQKGFTKCDRMERLKRQFLLENDSVRHFISEECELRADGKCRVMEAYERYREFCGQSGFKPFAINEFGKRVLRTPGVVREERDSSPSDSSRRPWLYTGITMKSKIFGML